MRVQGLDPAHELSVAFKQDFSDAVREGLRLPVPLGMDTFETDPDSAGKPPRAYVSLRSNFRAKITRDGHVVDVQGLGGSRNAAFDAAIAAAIARADSSGQVPSPKVASMEDRDHDFAISIATTVPTSGRVSPPKGLAAVIVTVSSVPGPPAFDRPLREPEPVVDDTVVFPLFAYRTPWRAVTQGLRQTPGFGNLRYPDAMRRSRTSGHVWVSYVVEPDGAANRETTTVLRADDKEFVQSIMNAMPNFRFTPMQVEGCAVRALARQPFSFYMMK